MSRTSYGAVALLEVLDPLVAERVDEVVDEGLARHVAHGERRGVLGDVLRDGLEQVRLAEAGAAVDEERVVRLRRRFGDGERGRVREAIRRADHERVERVLHVEPAALGPYRRSLDHGNDTLRARAVLRCVLDLELEGALTAEDVADGCADQAEEVALDPVARELARNDEHEGVVVELEAVDAAEPLAVRPVAEGLFEPPGNFLPEVLCRQLDLVLHRRPDPPVSGPAASITAALGRAKLRDLQGICDTSKSFHRCGQA